MDCSSASKFAFAVGLSLFLVGCNSTSTAPARGGSYSAARHSAIGSHIPQPASVDDANNKMNDSEFERMGQNSSTSSMRAASGGGR